MAEQKSSTIEIMDRIQDTLDKTYDLTIEFYEYQMDFNAKFLQFLKERAHNRELNQNNPQNEA